MNAQCVLNVTHARMLVLNNKKVGKFMAYLVNNLKKKNLKVQDSIKSNSKINSN